MYSGMRGCLVMTARLEFIFADGRHANFCYSMLELNFSRAYIVSFHVDNICMGTIGFVNWVAVVLVLFA